MRDNRDCEIVSSGGAPDAMLRCSPMMGWKLYAPDGSLVYPRDGYIAPEADWVFSARGAIFFGAGAPVFVALPAGEARVLPFREVVPLRGITGIDALAAAWSDSDAVLLDGGGAVLAHANPVEVTQAAAEPDATCRAALLLAIFHAEALANTRWMRLKRIGTVPDCAAIARGVLAGQESAGWRRLDPASLAPLDARVYATPKALLAAVLETSGP
ncbi:MAG: hypothetical protein GC147_00495 [Porphyrobacter sp.]|nr:hypothetical protein [Porphyrobacter sp.]